MSSNLTQQVEAAFAVAESWHSIAASHAFAKRAAAIEHLELHVLDRLERAAEREALPSALLALSERAADLQRRLERANLRFVQRLRSRIRAGRYTRAGLVRSLAGWVEPGSDAADYDALDFLVASLLDVGMLPDEIAVREREMVAYQPTPARAILALIERAKLQAGDVLIDLGSGLGWVVVLVALLSDARAIGIEFEPTYCEYARKCARALGASHAEFIHADARSAPLESGSVFFLYTPFRGEMLQRVLTRLRAEASRRAIRVCTYGPCTAEVAAVSWLEPRNGSILSECEIVLFDSLPPV